MNNVDQQTIDQDIHVMYIQASSFPEGIAEAHQRLHKQVPFSTDRKYIGLSRPEKGPIVYRAAAEILYKDEAEKYNLDSLIIPKGIYASLLIKDYMKDVAQIGNAFEILLSQPGIDPNGYCVEWYVNDKDVQCMVRLS